MTPRICFTASAFLIHQQQVLLIRHKKLQLWLGPGGHIDENELPHQAAAREFLEETGLSVAIVSALPFAHSSLEETTAASSVAATDVFHPVPLAVNEHWVCQENFLSRQAAAETGTPYQPTKLWSKGCERHLNFTYLARLDGPLEIKPAPGESQEVRFFSQQELANTREIALAPAIATEISLAFKLAKEHTS
jgi:ADP-ribose pyrophosphatase YjhB (NUDIX family)